MRRAFQLWGSAQIRCSKPGVKRRGVSARSTNAAVAAVTTASRSGAGGCDERRECRGLLLPARVVEEEAGKRRTPVFEHANERSARDMFRNAVFRRPREARSVERRLDDEV